MFGCCSGVTLFVFYVSTMGYKVRNDFSFGMKLRELQNAWKAGKVLPDLNGCFIISLIDLLARA